MVELLVASVVVVLATLMIGTTLNFFSGQSITQTVQIEQGAQAQSFLNLLRKDLASASDIAIDPPSPATPTGFKLKQKSFGSTGVVEHATIYTVGAPTTCKTSNQKSFSCVPLRRQRDTNAPATLPDVVDFRWCSTQLDNCSTSAALARLNQPLPARPARFIGQIDFMAHPERPAGQQIETLSFVYEATNLGAAIQLMKTE